MFQKRFQRNVTLCLFRIVQEVGMFVKHAKERRRRVDCSAHDDRIDLCISDSGTGFALPSAGETGLGVNAASASWMVEDTFLFG